MQRGLVLQAYDVVGLREVAVKVHQLSEMWADAKKASYVKHATREFEIHRSLQHPHIVPLLDIFELDDDSFATVLELCTGGDLDSFLAQHGVCSHPRMSGRRGPGILNAGIGQRPNFLSTGHYVPQELPEKEAKAVIAQVFKGLMYLNEDGRKIIHYDLKPGNILFDDLGRAKIAVSAPQGSASRFKRPTQPCQGLDFTNIRHAAAIDSILVGAGLWAEQGRARSGFKWHGTDEPRRRYLLVSAARVL